MKYRVTTRGWVVFSAIGILLIILLSSLFGGSPVVDNGDLEDPITTINEETSDVEEEVSETDLETELENNEADDEPVEETTEDVSQEETDFEEIVEEINLDKKSEILFDKNVSEISDEYYPVLDEWIDILTDQENLMVAIEGHINGYPYYEDGDFGLSLAQARADVIKEYLIEHGVSEVLIKTINMGSTIQVDVSDDIENHYLNRRAIIYFIEKP
ncbi:hypothetical protein EZV73_26990 [Acidaminobacter sp. JC074]|uniref:OmpA family protein n=1 Tax=Acidaminobacter sp. JC074 TaxID=2530199 RepID=UPI001F0FF34D|nr:OmpA family protein [Acidaminobacter sp. JC074]MCH4891246.1 hypothetical protein [Acidaminobacter sp. JC074]